MPDFKEMLKYYREKKGLSQAELACELGLSKSTISMYEVGAREPNMKPSPYTSWRTVLLCCF